jgi:branched-chain amino acid aminotransferase
MNVFIVRDGVLVTPPITDNILEGITRNTVIRVATEELGLSVVERPIDRTEIYLCQEVLLTGTAAQVTAVTWVDHRPVGDGVMGPVAADLRRRFKAIVRGSNPKYAGWLAPVYVKEQAGAAP